MPVAPRQGPPDDFLLAATGARGLVGRGLRTLVPGLAAMDRAPASPGSGGGAAYRLPPLDVADPRSVEEAFSRLAVLAAGRPVVVVHLAALTDTRSNDEASFERVNVQGTVNVLRGTASIGARLVHVSTDYVFAGMGRTGSPYDESDRPDRSPAGAYAASKFRAEREVFSLPEGEKAVVARIAFPYGGRGSRPGLAEKMLLRFEEARLKKESLPLFKDQAICPSFIPDVARGLLSLAGLFSRGGVPGRSAFHLVGAPTTPLAFGEEIRRAFGFEDVSVVPSSVEGTPYAGNLWLNSRETSRILGWLPTPHSQALRSLRDCPPG